MAVRARHCSFLEGPFHRQKAASKLLNDAFYAPLELIIKQLAGSDPPPKGEERFGNLTAEAPFGFAAQDRQAPGTELNFSLKLTPNSACSASLW
jgi:hypothetical protein